MDLIRRNFGLENKPVTETELREWLESRIAYMLEYEKDLLMSTLYRLDVEEGRIKWILEHLDQPMIANGLTELVLERQKQRMATKEAYRGKTGDFYWGEE